MKHLENITLIRIAVAAIIILAVAGAREMGWHHRWAVLT